MESRSSLDPIIETICRVMPAEMIFLLGIYPANPQTSGLEYDLLVLINKDDKRPMHEFESLIANRCHDLAMITASVYQSSYINQLLKKGNPFFSALCNPDHILYDSGRINLAKTDVHSNRYDQSCLDREFTVLISTAKSFLSGAISYRITRDFQQAAFMIHQTVEHTLYALLSPLIGFRIQTHNLNRLLIHARRFSIQFYTIFPRDTIEEIQLFQILYIAYIYGRYKNNFHVTEDKVQILIDRAITLLELVETIFSQKMADLNKIYVKEN